MIDDWIEEQQRRCRLCPRLCQVDRTQTQGAPCGAGEKAHFYLTYLHYGVEKALSPTQNVFLHGCNLTCLFCDTAAERQRSSSLELTPQILDQLMTLAEQGGATAVNFVGGEPLVNLPALLLLLEAAPKRIPVLCNTNLYCMEDTLEKAMEAFPLWVVDFKVGNDACAKTVVGASDYWDVLTARLKVLWEEKKDNLMVRHLVLPGHLDCCTHPILEWMSKHCPGIRLSLRTDYLVMPSARKDPRLNRFLTEDEINRAKDMAGEMGLRLVSGIPPSLPKTPQRTPCEPTLFSIEKGEDALDPQAQDPETEFILTPDGRLLVRHPTEDAVRLGRAIAGKEEPHPQ